MRAAVIVVENPFFAEVDDQGRYEITGVPEGRYTLVVWDMDGGSEEIEVSVTAEGRVETEVELAGSFNSTVQEIRVGLDVRTSGSFPGHAAPCCASAERDLD